MLIPISIGLASCMVNVYKLVIAVNYDYHCNICGSSFSYGIGFSGYINKQWRRDVSYRQSQVALVLSVLHSDLQIRVND